MGVYLEAQDFLSEDDWVDLRREAVAELMEDGLRVPGTALSDLIDAREILARSPYSEALFLLDRALHKIRADY